MERAVAPFARRFAAAPAVRALQEALPVAFGVVLLALVLLVAVPLPASWSEVPQRLRDAIGGAFAYASFAMVLVLAFRLAVRLRYPVVPTVAVTFLSFLLALPRDALHSQAMFERTLGASGLFTAIVVSLASAGAIALGRRRWGRMRGTIAGALAILLASTLLYSGHISLASVLSAVLAPLGTLGDSFIALLLITAIEAMLWLVGIHGPALLAAIVLPVYTRLQFENFAAYHAHAPLPHLVVVSTFLFVFPGGAGGTLPLVLLLTRSRVARLRKFAYAVLLPSLLNTNEPVIFGLPLAFNPILAVPFVLVPVVLACTSYAALALGLVGAPISYVPSTIPVFVNVFLATWDWRACVLVAVNLTIAGALWLPFVRVFERAQLVQAEAAA